MSDEQHSTSDGKRSRVIIFLEPSTLNGGPAITISIIPQVFDIPDNELGVIASLVLHELGCRQGLEHAIEQVLSMIQRGKLLRKVEKRADS